MKSRSSNLLVGRDAALKALCRVWDEAVGGRPGACVVVGSEGMGKTRLLEALAEAVRTRGGRVFEIGPPLLQSTLAGEALATVCGTRTQQDLAHELGRLHPEAPQEWLIWEAERLLRWVEPRPPAEARGSRTSGEATPDGPGGDAILVGGAAHDRAADLVTASLVGQPALLICDDLQRIDKGSVAWLQALAEQISAMAARVVIAASVCPQGRERACGILEQLDPVAVMLDPLSPSAAFELVAGLKPAHRTAREVEAIVQRGRGNPARLELLCWLGDRGEAPPDSWRAGVQRCLALLDDPTRSVLERLAIVDAPLPFPGSAAELLGEATSPAWNPEGAESIPWLEVKQDRVRLRPSTLGTTIVAAIPAARRAALHREAGQSLEDVAPLAAAHHFERAGDPVGLHRTMLAAARAATNRFEVSDAREYLQRALEGSSGQAPPAEVVLALARCELMLGRYVEAIEVLAARLVVRAGRERARACRMLGRAFERLGEYPLAESHLLEGLEALASGDGDDLRSGLLAELATVALRRGRHEEARRHAEAALLASPDGRSSEVDLAHSILGICHFRQSQLTPAVEHHERALAGRQERGDLPGCASSLNNLGNLHYEAGNWEQASQCFERALKIARAVSDAALESAILNNLAALHLIRGRLEAAQEASLAALERKERLGDAGGLAIARATLGRIAERKGDLEAARRTLEEASGRLEDLGAKETLAEVYASLGEVQVASGHRDRAWATLVRSASLARQTGAQGLLGRVFRALAKVLQLDGQPERGLSFARKAVDLARRTERPLELARSLTQLAELGGDPTGQAAREAADLFDALEVGFR